MSGIYTTLSVMRNFQTSTRVERRERLFRHHQLKQLSAQVPSCFLCTHPPARPPLALRNFKAASRHHSISAVKTSVYLWKIRSFYKIVLIIFAYLNKLISSNIQSVLKLSKSSDKFFSPVGFVWNAARIHRLHLCDNSYIFFFFFFSFIFPFAY